MRRNKIPPTIPPIKAPEEEEFFGELGEEDSLVVPEVEAEVVVLWLVVLVEGEVEVKVELIESDDPDELEGKIDVDSVDCTPDEESMDETVEFDVQTPKKMKEIPTIQAITVQ